MNAAPHRVGPYVVEGILGRGGAGIVYRARDMAGVPVAVKRIHVHDEELAHRLLREADVRVRHENVVRALAAGIDGDGQPYVVSELLEGESLRDRFARGITPEALVELMAQAARGLAALHAAGIVHRDLKPGNLFVTNDGVLKILDFGTASFAEAKTVLTVSGALMGTPAYFSPEQSRGERSLDPRTDLWSLGMILYEGLTGELPFHRSTIAATALAIQHDPLPSLFERASELPLDLGIIVERCLARRPSERPESAAQVAAHLEAIVFDASGRPSQPILPRGDETWRNVALVLLDDVADRAALEQTAAALEGATFPLLARSAVVLFGAETSRGDELSRALELALSTRECCRVSVVADARARTSGHEIDAEALEEAMALLQRAPRGVLLSAHAAAIAERTLHLRAFPDGAALVLGEGEPGALPVVGRDAELRALFELARRALEGEAVAAAIAGEAGIGKTALVRAFASRLDSVASSAAVIVATSGGVSPFGAILRALELEIPAESEPQRALDRRRLSILDRVGELLVGSDLLALVVEDVQHLDEHSAALLVELPALFAARPLLIVTTGRLGSGAAPPDITLGPLDSVAIATLVERELGGELARRVAGQVAQRAGGNPLFAEHLVRLAGAHGAVGAVAEWNLPLTVESAVQAQLDQLPQELREAVHGLAVLGPQAALVPTRLALGSRTDSLLSRLIAADVVELDVPPSRELDRVGWRFRSRIVQEVAYAALDARGAARLHRKIAERLACEPSIDPELVLEHADRGEAPALASRFARESFLRAARVGDGRRALELLPRIEREGGADFTALFLAAEAAAFVESALPPEELLERALARAGSGDERGAVLAELGERARRAGRLTEARKLLERARAETTVPAVAARARAREALVHVSEARAAEALALLDVPLDPLTPAVRALLWDTRGYVHGALGALGPRREAYDRAAALYAEAGDARRAAGANANLGDTMRQMGDLAAAEITLRRAATGAARLGNGLTEAYATTNLAGALISTSRMREALAMLEIASERAAAVGDSRLALVARLYRARAQGRGPDASDLAAARASDATLRTMALACHLELGSPADADIEEAVGLLAHPGEVEEGALDLGRALYRHRPTDEVRALVTARLTDVYRSIANAEWERSFVAHVRRALGPIAEPFLASLR